MQTMHYGNDYEALYDKGRKLLKSAVFTEAANIFLYLDTNNFGKG